MGRGTIYPILIHIGIWGAGILLKGPLPLDFRGQGLGYIRISLLSIYWNKSTKEKAPNQKLTQCTNWPYHSTTWQIYCRSFLPLHERRTNYWDLEQGLLMLSLCFYKLGTCGMIHILVLVWSCCFSLALHNWIGFSTVFTYICWFCSFPLQKWPQHLWLPL